MEKFNSHEKERESPTHRFEDFRGEDLSNRDFRQTPLEVLRTVDFDTETIWPSSDKLPNGFEPNKILEMGKDPGLGVRELHKQGITGKGVVVAIIDQKLDLEHPEYRDAIADYAEYGNMGDEEMSIHGPAVASLFVGKDCGVAPGAKLVYKAVPGGRDFLSETQALKDIIEGNKNAPSQEQVKIVSCSIGYDEENPDPGLDEWIESLKKAKEAGIFVVDVGGDQIDISFSGGGSPENKNDFESYLFWLRKHEGIAGEELNRIIFEGNVDEISKKLRETRKDELSSISDLDLRKKIETRLKELRSEIIVPSDYRTMASSWSKEGQYMYNGGGGISWSTPYLAGLYALALQVNPMITQEALADIVKTSATINSRGLRIVNPKGIIEMAQKHK